MKLNIIGQVLGTSGYACHTRNLAKAIHKLNPETSIETQLPTNWHQLPDINDSLFAMITANYNQHTNLAISTPPFWPYALSDRPENFIGFLVFEGSKIPQHWAEICSREDIKQIWVPSQHVKSACLNSGISENKIHVIPHGVDTEIFHPNPNPFPQLEKFKSDKTTFIWNKGWAMGESDRSNLPAFLRAFCEEFKSDEPVRALIKLNPAYFPPGFNLSAEIKKLNLPEKTPELIFITQTLPTEAMPYFYSLGDCYVSTSRAEGFNLPVLEAMACGLPVIANSFGGEADFVKNDSGILLSYQLVPTPKDAFHLSYEEAEWGEVDKQELKNALRLMYQSPDKRKAMGKAALAEAKLWTWDNSARKAIDALTFLEK